MARGQRLLPYLDVPFQHASPRILKLMKRPANAGEHARAHRARGARSAPTSRSAARSSPAFPGETEAEFDELLAFLDEARARPRRLLRLLAGRRRRGQRAARTRCPTTCARSAARASWQCRRRSARARLARKVGRTLDAIVDAVETTGRGAGKRVTALGRSTADAPEIDGVVRIEDGASLAPGQIVRVTITSADAHDLRGVAASTRGPA